MKKTINFALLLNYEMKISKKRYLQAFGLVVIALAFIRCLFPSVAEPYNDNIARSIENDSDSIIDNRENVRDSVTEKKTQTQHVASRFFHKDGSLVKNPIYSVPHFGNTFPDLNDVQLEAAKKHGVSAVIDREDAEKRKSELVYVGSNPYFHVDKLNSSIPYLVPEASILLQDIGRNFFDSLQIKGIPLHKIIVTSVLRSKADIAKLRNHNANATENSCHLYGTTFDICYNRYKTVEDPNGPSKRQVRNDTLKWVLSEVLNDMRRDNRCFIKYEMKQGCFHITVK